MKVNLLQYADDLVLLADSPTGLQHSLNLLYSYCSTWDLKINTDKTKIMVFHSRQADTNRYEFQLNNNPIERVTMYKYLGIVLSESGSLKLTISTLANQANKALFILQKAISKLSYPKPSLLLHLFDSLVRPVLDYGCEIWGYLPTEDLELIHRKFFASLH